MRIVSTNFIPDRSRPGLTTTAIGAVDLQGAGGNWATVGRRSRGGRRVRRQREKRKGKSVGLRIGTLNVGTMTGKGRELADVMERRKVDILCVQETRWKGSKACSIGAGFKLFYYGVDSKRNGVGVVLKEEFVRNVLEVKRVSDRVMSLKLEIEGVMLNVVSGYAPQVGCELEEKERFWSELDEVMESIPTGERVVIGADFNGHVGEGNTGDEEVMGKFGVKERNLEGQMVVDFAKRMDMGVVNTYFQKREEHRVTYKSGGRRTQVDYILCRRGNLKEISDCKVVVGESVARQHRMVVCRMTLMVCKTKRSKIEKKTKWWKLKKEECCEEFRQKLRQALGGQVVLPDDWETTAEVIRETGRKVLGVSSGRRKEDKETWWWNEEVQDSVQRKRLAKKKWDMDRTEENRQEYKELQRRVKREVSKAKQKAYEELYTRLDTREGEKDLYRLARQRDRDGKDVQQVRVIKDRDGRVLTSEESVQRRWKEYFEELMNEENEREKRVEGVNSVEQKVDKIRKDEVRKALKRMKSGKAVGPDDIPVEVWKCLGEAAVEFLANLFNRVLESERMPEEWRRSVLVPIFKNKGDVQSCSNYRGIKLMSHTMKLWERVVEARLRKVVEICEQQYGFMPRKSTTDAIFALRILMEKYRDGQKELHCVFVDLEKAYDRVPREELWYCMRKSGVAEKYVRVVQDMYERSRTVVRCAVGQTEKFNVEVGLHQGSALSPFLFAIVMDQLSEEVRQESPWTMMFADDIVICSESREQVEENLERWRFALERRGMKVSRSKTEYMCVNEREGSGTVRLQGEEVKKVQEFKYLGSTVQSNGECGKEVKKRVQAGWNGWRKVSGVLCDRKISARIKGKVYRTVVRPAMLYGLETVSMRKRQESELEVAELKMLRFSLGVTRLDRIRNEYIRGTAHVGRLGDKVREARLRWFGHVQRRDNTHTLQYFYTARINFTAVGLLDGEQFVYYDSNIRKMIPKTEWMQKISADDPDYWKSETDKQLRKQDTFKFYLSSVMKSFNQTEGVHTLQRMYGCELHDDSTTRGSDQFGYNGEDFISLDLNTGTWTADTPQAEIFIKEWDPTGDEAKEQKSYLEKECIYWIRNFVSHGRETLERKDPPTASVIQKHSPSPEVVCHATGCFPKAVNITWRKDGGPVYKDVEVRETLPNQDGSFQKRSILKVPAEELQKHTYTCVIQHSSLEEELVLPVNITNPDKSKYAGSDAGSNNRAGVGHVIGVVVALVVLVALIVAGIMVWKKKNSGERRKEADVKFSENRYREVSVSVPPTASVIQKHSPSPEMVCHATGFFPKAVNISWRKDGEDVNEDVEVRETLPNQDGSFQKRSILKVPAEELQKHTYTCVIQHSSLEEELVLTVNINKPEKCICFKPVPQNSTQFGNKS
ncbi:hypothetical protein QTP86_015646 [Hemibagrus guttatus]|nr:hypothetical protein QTP86_015646 [Hemibagrus guttatus]